MQCSEETIAKLFYNVSSSFNLFLFFSYFTFILLAKFFFFLGGNPFSWRNQYGYEFSDEEMDDENEYYDNKSEEINGGYGSFDEDELDKNCTSRYEEESIYSSVDAEYILGDDEENIPRRDDIKCDSEVNQVVPTPDLNTNGPNMIDSEINHGNSDRKINRDKKVIERNLRRDENIFVYAAPPKMEDDEHEIFGDSCTVGSTSKSSTEWKSSIRDSATEDPFSSSSRRSCPKWESYTVFQKYDEEMLFLDRITVQKLHETESLRSIKACPRSISDRIVHKLATKNKGTAGPYHELEAAYVAQVCLAWEALSWNYKYFQRVRASRKEKDTGCPGYVAQQFQQFQVLLQRYVESEPYEHGRRPQIYANMRSLSPKLLQVPEYRDSDEEKGQDDEDHCSRISSESFLKIMNEAITTFMNFLKADKENCCQMIMSAFFRRNRRGSTLLQPLKKVNKKKKSKVKDVGRSGKCLKGKRRLREEEEMDILMALIDLKVVSRVLRMSEVNDEQLHWCEAKMSKIRVSQGKLQRDSSPLFFPAH